MDALFHTPAQLLIYRFLNVTVFSLLKLNGKMQLRPDINAAEVNTGTATVVSSPWTSPSTEHGDNSV